MTLTSACSVSGRRLEMERASPERIAAIRLAWVEAGNARCPVVIS